MDVKKLTLDKQPRFRFAVLSVVYGARGQFKLEESYGAQDLAERYFQGDYRKVPETNFYLVDFKTSTMLAKCESFQSRYTELITGPNPETPDPSEESV
jgi:hypothetical protein